MASEPDPDMTAAELALGLLEGEERATAMRRVLAEPDFAREVEDWRQRMAGLFDDYPEVAAPGGIAERLATPERDVVRLQPRARWPLVATLTALAAVVVLFFAVQPGPVAPPTLEPHKMMVASLMMSDKSRAVPAVIDMNTGEMRVASTGMAPAGKAAELWMIGDDGVPKSMGMLDSKNASKMTLPADKRSKLNEGMTLAVSIEPIGGSPTGLPTGPVVASGKLSVA